MDPDDLQELRNARPFVPFRLYMADGRTFDVRHPEFVLVGRRGNAVIFESDDATSRRFDRYAHIAVLHATRAEPLETASPH
jgi:hypothetical protein